MRRSWTPLSAFLMLAICATAPLARAAQIRGFVDAFNAQLVTGWACVPGSGQVVRISLFAGNSLLGTFPAQLNRPDLGPVCGGGTAHGFAIWFSPVMQAQFLGQASLTVSASVADGAPQLLPSSNPLGTNPHPIPYGQVSYFDAGGRLMGIILSASGMRPQMNIYAGAQQRMVARHGAKSACNPWGHSKSSLSPHRPFQQAGRSTLTRWTRRKP